VQLVFDEGSRLLTAVISRFGCRDGFVVAGGVGFGVDAEPALVVAASDCTTTWRLVGGWPRQFIER
jgi:hypothetical protein